MTNRAGCHKGYSSHVCYVLQLPPILMSDCMVMFHVYKRKNEKRERDENYFRAKNKSYQISFLSQEGERTSCPFVIIVSDVLPFFVYSSQNLLMFVILMFNFFFSSRYYCMYVHLFTSGHFSSQERWWEILSYKTSGEEETTLEKKIHDGDLKSSITHHILLLIIISFVQKQKGKENRCSSSPWWWWLCDLSFWNSFCAPLLLLKPPLVLAWHEFSSSSSSSSHSFLFFLTWVSASYYWLKLSFKRQEAEERHERKKESLNATSEQNCWMRDNFFISCCWVEGEERHTHQNLEGETKEMQLSVTSAAAIMIIIMMLLMMLIIVPLLLGVIILVSCKRSKKVVITTA